MTVNEYFGDWLTVIDKEELSRVTVWLSNLKSSFCPSLSDVFKAFTLCSLKDCKIIFLSQDPYPQRGVATGIAFGNNTDNISPSLEVLKEAAIDYSIPHQELEFDNSLESWGKQGILLLNSSLTCELNNPMSHTLNWRQFTAKLLRNISCRKPGIIYVLFGKYAQSFDSCIDSSNTIIKTEHPSWYARNKTKMSPKLFTDINSYLKDKGYEKIIWYKDYNLKRKEYEEDDFFWPCAL